MKRWGEEFVIVASLFLFIFLGLSVETAKGGVWSRLSGILAREPEFKSSQEVMKVSGSQSVAYLEANSETGEAGATSTPSSTASELSISEDGAILPNAGPMGTAADIKEAKPTSDQISVYVVKKGDNISDIAKMFDVSANTIRWANDLKKGQALTEGQTLVILPVTGIQHVVKKGDTVKSLVKKYGGDEGEIIAYNDIDTEKGLVVGQTVIIPDGDLVETPSSPSKPSSGSGKSNPRPEYKGYYQRPVAGGLRTQGIHGHNGIDIASSYGTPIYAAAGGRVIIARSSGWNGGYGSYVVVSHSNGTQTLYAHLSAVTVSQGQQVGAGQQIGKMGDSGKSTGVHLHFEVRGARNPF